MIRSFRSADTEALFSGKKVARFFAFRAIAERKLAMLHRAVVLDDLRMPPGNRLEALKGDREGQMSIRINDRWRICFSWHEGNAHDVEIVDYH